MSIEGHDCWEDCDEGPHGCVCGNECEPPEWMREQDFRDRISADFKAGRIGVLNGWLVEYNDPCPSPCAGVEYGCPPSCLATPLADLWAASRPAAPAEQGETEWEYGRVGHFVADGRDAHDDAALIDRRTAEVNVRLSNEWEENHSPDVRVHYMLARRRAGSKPGPWLPVPGSTVRESDSGVRDSDNEESEGER